MACRVGYYNEKGHDAKCNKCPETTTTAGSGSDSISNCNVCDANYCDSDGTKKSLVDQESVACRCKCKKNYISTTCSRKINCLLGPLHLMGYLKESVTQQPLPSYGS